MAKEKGAAKNAARSRPATAHHEKRLDGLPAWEPVQAIRLMVSNVAVRSETKCLVRPSSSCRLRQFVSYISFCVLSLARSTRTLCHAGHLQTSRTQGTANPANLRSLASCYRTLLRQVRDALLVASGVNGAIRMICPLHHRRGGKRAADRFRSNPGPKGS